MRLRNIWTLGGGARPRVANVLTCESTVSKIKQVDIWSEGTREESNGTENRAAYRDDSPAKSLDERTSNDT